VSADLKIQVDPDLKNVRNALAALDSDNKSKGSKTKLLAALNKELRDNIGKRVVQAEKDSLMSTQIKGEKQSGQLRHKRGTQKSTGFRRRIAASFEYKNQLSNKKEAGIIIRASTGKLARSGLSPKTARQANTGSIRHPLFGDREHWYATKFVPSGFWEKTRRDMTPYVNRQIEEITKKFERVVILEAMKGKQTSI